MTKTSAHLFALYYPLDKKIGAKDRLVITDPELVHRISRVLRLSTGDTCILFDQNSSAHISIDAIERSTVTGTVRSWQSNKKWDTKLIFFLPLLKREALAAAVYNLVEAGVQEIQLVETQKTQRSFGGTKEIERLERIVIAAAEQSKNFVFPVIKAPISLENALILMKKMKSYVGDLNGMSVLKALDDLPLSNEYALFIGPEGDFTPDEWEYIYQAQIVPIRLTPTILRAESAAFYLAAIFRSRLSSS